MKVKAERKAMANYLIMPYSKNNQNPTPGSPMLGSSVGPALLHGCSASPPGGDLSYLRHSRLGVFRTAHSSPVKPLAHIDRELDQNLQCISISESDLGVVDLCVERSVLLGSHSTQARPYLVGDGQSRVVVPHLSDIFYSTEADKVTQVKMAASPNKEMEDYWNEFKTIERPDVESDEDELSKTPDEGEIEAAWLETAGYGFLVNKFQDGRDLSDGELETITHSLTRAQAEAVQKRVNKLSTTIRGRNKANKTHIRDIFPEQSTQPLSTSSQKDADLSPLSVSPISGFKFPSRQDQITQAFQRKGGYAMTGDSNQFTEGVDGGVQTLGIHPHRQGSRKEHVSRLPSVSDIEISLDFHLEETEKAPLTPTHGPDPHRVDLP
ncbi:rho GTPase-activating protein 18, partial [Plakobranchus ocellatus]